MEQLRFACPRRGCGRIFYRRASRRPAAVKVEFCSAVCREAARGDELPPLPDRIQVGTGGGQLAVSPLLALCGRNRGDLTEAYLVGLWTAQGGRCALSGVPLEVVARVRGVTSVPRPPTAAVIDCVSGNDVRQGNVRFVSLIAKNARSGFTDAQLYDFCNAAAKFEYGERERSRSSLDLPPLF